MVDHEEILKRRIEYARDSLRKARYEIDAALSRMEDEDSYDFGENVLSALQINTSTAVRHLTTAMSDMLDIVTRIPLIDPNKYYKE